MIRAAGPRRLTLVIASLGGGGAERVLTLLANSWTSRGVEVTLITLDADDPFFPLDPRVSHRPLGVAGVSANLLTAVWNNLRRVRALRRAIRASRPEVVISFLDVINVLTLLATRGLGVPVAVSERSDPAFCTIGRSFGVLRRWLYPRADGVVVQSEEARSFFSPAIQSRTTVIPNPVLPGERRGGRSSGSAAAGGTVISLGRLSREKGFDILISAFARIARQRNEWSLEIWGEGPERPNLERMVADSGLAGRVRLPGQTSRTEEMLARADIFVLPSRYEGFPNALCEAMACGLPVVAADCPSGPRQIIRHELDGILVPAGDPSALADGMLRLMDDRGLANRLASRACEVTTRFSLDRILDLWEKALAQVVIRQPVRRPTAHQ